jgi:hypothetical protein
MNKRQRCYNLAVHNLRALACFTEAVSWSANKFKRLA